MKRKNILTVLICAVLLTAGCGVSGCAAAGGGTESGEHTAQGMKYIEELSYEEALTSFDAALLNKEDPQAAYRGQGIAYMGLTDYEKAAECLERALSYSDASLDQMDFDVNYYLATAYYKLGELDKAKGVYEAIVAMRPKEKNAWYLKGVVELEQGDTEAAGADFDRAVAIDEKDYDLRIDIFCSYAEHGQQELGQEYLQAVLDSDDKNLTDYNRGRMSFYLGDYSTARTELEKAKETTGSSEVISLLGQTYEALGDYNYAASVYSNYLNETPDAQIYNQLGLCDLQIGEYEGALAAFQAGIAMEGNSLMQSLKFNEIVAYEYLGDFNQAKVLMQKYLETYPDDARARREYEFLETR